MKITLLIVYNIELLQVYILNPFTFELNHIYVHIQFYLPACNFDNNGFSLIVK